MKKNKLLIAGIILGSLIFLTGFTNVIGSQNPKSYVNKDSPLFNTRLVNEIRQYKKNANTIDFVGKNSNTISLSLNSVQLQIQKIQNKLKRMSDKKFTILKYSVIEKAASNHEVQLIKTILDYFREDNIENKNEYDESRLNGFLAAFLCLILSVIFIITIIVQIITGGNVIASSIMLSI